MIDVRSLPVERPAIRVRTERVNQVLGTALSTAAIADYLAPIGFDVAAQNGTLDVVPPSFRPDVSIEENVIEEVARHHGYMNIERTIPRRPFVGTLSPYQKARRKLREVLVGAGVSEALGVPLLAPGEHARTGLLEDGAVITAPDPLAREESVLRTSLLPGLLRAVAFNLSHRSGDVALFEIGHVFRVPADSSAPLPDEHEVVGAVVADAVVAKRVFDLLAGEFDRAVALRPVDEPGLHPTRTAAVELDGAVVGHVGEVDPDVLGEWGIEGRLGWIGLDLEAFLPLRPAYLEARPISRFPSSDIDLAFAVPDAVAAGAVEVAIRGAAGDLLESVALFDVYRDADRLGEGVRSLAYRLRFQARDRTLTDDDVAAARQRIITAVESSLGASLRG
jgi:phenylalanyl-tRNA synthetase beta chain